MRVFRGTIEVSLKNTSERIKRRVEDLKDEVKGTVEGLGGNLPRPLMERKTFILKQPLLAILRDRIKERTK